MKQIPRVQIDDQPTNQLQQNILSVINPLLSANPELFGNLLTNQALTVGKNTITTGLTQSLIGWIIVRKRGLANIYDIQDSNNTIGTLILNTDTAVSVDLWVF